MKSSKIPSAKISDDEQERCRKVIAKAKKRELDVLYAFADGLSRQQVAYRLGISIKTVDMHKTNLLELCRNEWGFPPNKRLPYRFLIVKFAKAKNTPQIPSTSEELSTQEHVYCCRVIAKAKNRELEVLYAFADGLSPRQVANQLGISKKTVDTHKTRLLALCRYTWNLPLDKWLDYRFLNTKFADFSSHIKQKGLVYVR